MDTNLHTTGNLKALLKLITGVSDRVPDRCCDALPFAGGHIFIRQSEICPMTCVPELILI